MEIVEQILNIGMGAIAVFVPIFLYYIRKRKTLQSLIKNLFETSEALRDAALNPTTESLLKLERELFETLADVADLFSVNAQVYVLNDENRTTDGKES